MRQVSLYLSDLEMDWTSSFLVESDKLAIVLHLLLAPVGTVAKPAEHEVAHRSSPIPERCRRCDRLVEEQGFDTYILMFSELPVFGEVLVILVFSKPFGLITCKGSGLSNSATQQWP